MTQRIGATSKATIAPAVLQQLNQGVLTTATLSEALAVDFADLMQNVFPAITPDAITRMQQAAGLGITKRMELAATMLSEQLSPKQLNALSQHPSDTVRGWAAYSIAIAPSPQLENTLDRVMEDPSRYVQDSCANWLNDAAKSNPDWVIHYCDQWRKQSTLASLSYITRRALRSTTDRK